MLHVAVSVSVEDSDGSLILDLGESDSVARVDEKDSVGLCALLRARVDTMLTQLAKRADERVSEVAALVEKEEA